MKAWIVVPVLVLAVAAAMTILFVRPQDNVASQSPQVATCDSTSGPGVTGKVDFGEQRAKLVVQILLQLPYGEEYLDQVRRQAGLPVSGASQLALGDLQGIVHTMRYAHVGSEGAFSCRPLDPGKYMAFATVQRSGQVGVEVAPFVVASGTASSAMPDDSFRPLQEYR